VIAAQVANSGRKRCYQVGDIDGGLPFGGDVSDDRLGKPDHKLFQLAILVLETVQDLFQMSVTIDFIEKMRPVLLRNSFLHDRFLRLEAAVILTTRKNDLRKFGNSTDAYNHIT
jgi:hypothetical protein